MSSIISNTLRMCLQCGCVRYAAVERYRRYEAGGADYECAASGGGAQSGDDSEGRGATMIGSREAPG